MTQSKFAGMSTFNSSFLLAGVLHLPVTDDCSETEDVNQLR